MSQSTQYILPAMGIGRKIIDLPVTAGILNLLVKASFIVGVPVSPTLAQWATYISSIEVILDGHQVWKVSMANYVAWLQYNKVTTEDGNLPIYFHRPWEDDLGSRNHGMLGTKDLDTVQVAFEFVTADIIDFQLAGSIVANQRIGQFYGFTERPLTLASTGQHDLRDFPDGKDYATVAIHFNISTISQIEVMVGSKVVDDTDLADRLQKIRDIGKTAQAGFTHLDFAREGDVRGVFPMNVRDTTFRVTTTNTPGAITALHEYIQDFSKIRRALA